MLACGALAFAVAASSADLFAPLGSSLRGQSSPGTSEDFRNNPDGLFGGSESPKAPVTYAPKPGPTRKRNVTFPESLFDGEHLHPYEHPFDLKRTALLGSWSVEPGVFVGYGVGSEDEGFGLDFQGRVKYGVFGIDANFMLTDFDDTPMISILAGRGILDLDIYHWLNVRPMLGLFQMDFDNQPNDHGALIGIETEIWPMQPLTFGASFQAYLPEERNVIRDAFLYVGIIPTLFGDTQPKWFPELRVGWRRIVGSRGTINDNMIVLQLALEF